MYSTGRFGGRSRTLCVTRWYVLGILAIHGQYTLGLWASSNVARTLVGCLRPLGILGCSLYFGGMSLCSCTFILVGSNGSVMLGPKATSPIRSISRVHASVIGLIFLERYILVLPKSQAQCCFLKFGIPHPYTIERNIFFHMKKIYKFIAYIFYVSTTIFLAKIRQNA